MDSTLSPAGSTWRSAAVAFPLAAIVATIAFLVLFVRKTPTGLGVAAAMGCVALLNVAALAQLLRHVRDERSA